MFRTVREAVNREGFSREEGLALRFCIRGNLFPFGTGAKGDTEFLKKVLQNLGAFCFHQPVFDFGTVVKIHGKKIAYRAAGSAFAVFCAADHPGDPGINDGTGAHGTWL